MLDDLRSALHRLDRQPLKASDAVRKPELQTRSASPICKPDLNDETLKR
jgi:hypothetical protein